MQPQLTRSRTEVVIAGVCGGLAEYFHIDPVIVRLVFVLVTLTSGIGLIVYPVLWMVMPQAPAPATPLPAREDQPPGHGALPSQESGYAAPWAPQAVRLQEPARQAGARSAGPPPFADQPPPEEEYRFDPLTGEPIRRETPSTGQTVDLSRHPGSLTAPLPPSPDAPGQSAPAARRRISWAGVILVGIGVMLLAEQIGIDPDIMFPIIMVVFGALLLFRR
jgi:phage shock protein C